MPHPFDVINGDVTNESGTKQMVEEDPGTQKQIIVKVSNVSNEMNVHAD